MKTPPYIYAFIPNKETIYFTNIRLKYLIFDIKFMLHRLFHILIFIFYSCSICCFQQLFMLNAIHDLCFLVPKEQLSWLS